MLVLLTLLVPLALLASASPVTLGVDPESWICPGYAKGSVVQGLISIYDEGSRTRDFRLICENLLDAGLLHYPGLEWQGSSWQWVRRRLEIPEPPALLPTPGNWDSSVGCRGHEILVGINSVTGSDGVQRYELVCVEYLSVRVATAACGWRSETELGANFLVMTPPGEPFGPYVFNRVRSRFNNATGDRTFELQACAAYTVNEWPSEKSRECKLARISARPEDVGQITGRVFTSYRTSDVQECAKICANHWFCYTFLWRPSMSHPDTPNCQLSYRPLAKEEECMAEALWHSGLSHLGEDLEGEDVALVVPCFQCLRFEQAEAQLNAEKRRIRHFLI